MASARRGHHKCGQRVERVRKDEGKVRARMQLHYQSSSVSVHINLNPLHHLQPLQLSSSLISTINRRHSGVNPPSMSSAPILPHVLLAVTGSVATIKLEPLLDLLLPTCDVRVITSQRARHFFNVQRVAERVKLYQDEDEWHDWKRGDPVLHIEVTQPHSSSAQCTLCTTRSAATCAHCYTDVVCGVLRVGVVLVDRQLRKWADVFVIAPLSANSLAELATGLCPNLVVSQPSHHSLHRRGPVQPQSESKQLASLIHSLIAF